VFPPLLASLIAVGLYVKELETVLYELCADPVHVVPT
jgi:hypothetical protein